jgi:predicted NAD/FAD-dependent oxidoreductase
MAPHNTCTKNNTVQLKNCTVLFFVQVLENINMTTHTTEVAIIGAGTSGCFIASLLNESGIDCYLIEKSRGLGGRCSRRRIDNYGIDLGAPDFSIDSIENQFLINKVDTWLESGYLSPWYKRVSSFNSLSKTDTIKTLCAKPSMNSWHKKLSSNTKSLTNCKVDSLKKVHDHWELLDEYGNIIIQANKVIVTSPAEQAFDLLKDFDGFSVCQTIANQSLPQYVCAISFSESLKINSDVYVDHHPIIKSAIRESSKPGRVVAMLPHETWTLHSTYEWAQKQNSTDSQQAAIDLTKAFCNHFSIEAQPNILTSHYWRLAAHHTSDHHDQNFIWNKSLQIGCCGDWLDSGNISGALNSSFALSQKLLNMYN